MEHQDEKTQRLAKQVKIFELLVIGCDRCGHCTPLMGAELTGRGIICHDCIHSMTPDEYSLYREANERMREKLWPHEKGVV